MFLNFGNKRPPDVKVSACPEVRTLLEDVMRQDVVVAKGRDYRHDEVVGRIVVRLVLVLCKDFVEFVDEQLVEVGDLLYISRYLLVVVMARGIAGPDDKVDRVLELVADPVEGGIDERNRRVAVGRLGTIITCWAVASMACAVLVDG